MGSRCLQKLAQPGRVRGSLSVRKRQELRRTQTSRSSPAVLFPDHSRFSPERNAVILVLRVPDDHGPVAGIPFRQAQLFLHRRPVARSEIEIPGPARAQAIRLGSEFQVGQGYGTGSRGHSVVLVRMREHDMGSAAADCVMALFPFIHHMREKNSLCEVRLLLDHETHPVDDQSGQPLDLRGIMDNEPLHWLGIVA